MIEVQVKPRALWSALQASANTYPYEFLGLFRGEVKDEVVTIDELIIAPLASYQRNHSSFSDWHLPINMGIVASFHSHPDSIPRPSRQDLQFFTRNGACHFIAASPYQVENVRAYDTKGRPVQFTMV